MSEDDRTRAVRPPQDRRPLPGRADGPPRAAGAPAHQVPGVAGTAKYESPAMYGTPAGQGEQQPSARSRVYGKVREGKSPVRPFKSDKDRQPPAGQGGPPDGGRPGGRMFSGGTSGARGKFRLGTLVKILAALLAALLVLGVVGFFWIDGRINTIAGVLDDYEGRPADGPGTNWLLVGSDSRKGLTAAQRRKLATGKAVGRRTDSMMLLHLSDSGEKATLVSLPRDSAVTIPGNGRNKLNAAYSDALKGGGPQLLVRTVEGATGLRIDNYMEIGFAGFVGIVDAVGGVEINVTEAINDPKAGLKLKKGKQILSGGEALGYVRTRYNGALPDYERTKRQRQFLGAVVKKAASPGVLINPFTSIPLATAATDSVDVSEGTGAFDLLSLGLAMGDSPVTTVVPFGGTEQVAGGEGVKWDRTRALALFNALAEDKPVPKEALQGN
ncbi:LCP family protein [Nonomuraea soli]|uniref:LCP family protein required for cell wall assembly n=1 Tax=Nonomuraea soli TaxID=1032476 RepID=A0A7W0HQI8_9ACTN|nr:LCP family protein [Nonomuraea soli]MBA2891686.1 LCP family protein required for cell wall assembly [Nonomuraea soli]